MYLFSEKTLSDDYSVWWCGSLTYLRTSNIFNQRDDYTSSDIIQIKEVSFYHIHIIYRNYSQCAVYQSSLIQN